MDKVKELEEALEAAYSERTEITKYFNDEDEYQDGPKPTTDWVPTIYTFK